jgi:Domain of unknown function (DUF4386)
MGSVTFLDFPLIGVKCLSVEPNGFALDESWRAMAATYTCTALRRATGMLFVAGALAFAAAATVLSSTFDWPDILREPAGVVLPTFLVGGAGLVWTWFATAWTYAILAVPILLLPAVLGRRDDPVLVLSVVILRARVLPRWLGVSGLVVSGLYLLNQGDVLATAVPGFPIWDLAGLLGSTGWGLWVAALGVTILLRPARTRSSSTSPETNGVDGVDGVSALDTPLREHAHHTAAGPGRVELRP